MISVLAWSVVDEQKLSIVDLFKVYMVLTILKEKNRYYLIVP
jgi:hypothetical protein